MTGSDRESTGGVPRVQPRKERRRHYRVEAQDLVVSLHSREGILSATAMDASAGGIAIAVARAGHRLFSRADRVTLVLQPRRAPAVEIPCMVARQHGGGTDSVWYGLRFIDRSVLATLPQELREVLNRRAAWRVRPRRPVEVELTAAPGDAYWRSSSTGRLIDASQVGLGIVLPTTLASRFEDLPRMAVRLDLPGCEETTAMSAAIVYRSPFASGTRMGLRIDYVESISSSRARTQLRDFVMRRMYEDAWRKPVRPVD